MNISKTPKDIRWSRNKDVLTWERGVDDTLSFIDIHIDDCGYADHILAGYGDDDELSHSSRSSLTIVTDIKLAKAIGRRLFDNMFVVHEMVFKNQ